MYNALKVLRSGRYWISLGLACLLFKCSHTINQSIVPASSGNCSISGVIRIQSVDGPLVATLFATTTSLATTIDLTGPLGIPIASIRATADSVYIDQGDNHRTYPRFALCAIPELSLQFPFTFGDFVRILVGDSIGVHPYPKGSTTAKDLSANLNMVYSSHEHTLAYWSYDWKGTTPWHLVFSKFKDHYPRKIALSSKKRELFRIKIVKRVCH